MSRSFEPDSKPEVYSHRSGNWEKSEQTNAEITLGPLTSEVLRDIARNESSSRPWRKAAVKFLVKRSHPYQCHPDFRELLEEIKEEQEAEKEVQAIVESAVEEPLSPESEL
jgi:hypothetical protein